MNQQWRHGERYEPAPEDDPNFVSSAAASGPTQEEIEEARAQKAAFERNWGGDRSRPPSWKVI